MTPWLTIVGLGEDGLENLSARARDAIARAALVVGGARHLALAGPIIRGSALAWPSPLRDGLPAIAARRGEPVVVLASGDPNWFGIGQTLRDIVPAGETTCLPAISSGSLACARLGWNFDEIDVVSACGRPLVAVLSRAHAGRRMLVLSADETTPAALADLLCSRGFGASRLHVLEALGGPRERARSLHAADTMPANIDRLNLVAVEVAGGPGIARVAGLPDEMFEHDGQLTKCEVRAATLAALAPRAGEFLWDIGCGSGSIAIEWCLAHPANRAIAIERDSARASRARRNALALGVPGVEVRDGAAPEALENLPPPDAVFVGGGASEAVFDAAWAALRPSGRLVVNAISIETQALLFGNRARLGGGLIRLSVERLDTLGHLHGFRPAMAVTQFAVTKPC